MTVLYSQRASAYIWQLASFREARQNKQATVISKGVDAAHIVPTVSRLLNSRMQLPPDCTLSARPAEIANISRKYGLEGMAVDVFIGCSGSRQSELIRCRRLPREFRHMQFVRLEPDVFICTPEMCLLQLALILPPEQLLLLMTEWCGKYVLDKCLLGGVGKRQPLTSPQGIREFVDMAARKHGSYTLRETARLIRADSESPRESVFGICHSLGCSNGGYGLSPLLLNGEVELSESARQLYNVAKCRCDIYYPTARLAFEYQSKTYHEDWNAQEKDKSRIAALQIMGVDVVEVCAKQVESRKDMDALALIPARRLGIALDLSDGAYAAKRDALQSSLLSRTEWNFRRLLEA